MKDMLARIINISWCARRAPQTHIESDFSWDVSKSIHDKFESRLYAAAIDDASKSTDSSGGDHDDSFDGFDTESDAESLMPNSEPSDSEVDSDVEMSSRPDHLKARGCLNPHAAPFVPGAVAVQEQAAHSVLAEELHSNQAEVVDSATLGNLLQALSKLTPPEAAKLRAFLDDHLASQEAGYEGDSSKVSVAAPQHVQVERAAHCQVGKRERNVARTSGRARAMVRTRTYARPRPGPGLF